MVFEHSAKLTLRLHNSANFQPILTTEISKSKLTFFLSNEIWLVEDLADFTAELLFSKLVHIFWEDVFTFLGHPVFTFFRTPCIHIFGTPCIHIFRTPCIHIFRTPCIHIFRTLCIHIFRTLCIHIFWDTLYSHVFCTLLKGRHQFDRTGCSITSVLVSLCEHSKDR